MESNENMLGMNQTKQREITKTFNPHLKKILKEGELKPEESKVQIEKNKIQNETEKLLPSESKEYLATELIQEGFIDSFVDFFYIGWRKTPDVKSKYMRDFLDENENKESTFNTTDRHSYDMKTLKGIQETLKQAEQLRREARDKSDIEKAIEKYTEVRTKTLYDKGVRIEAIYFNQKCIDLSQRHLLIKSLIMSLIYMGDCFDVTQESKDMQISMELKEKAKSFFVTNLYDKEKNYWLEGKIYVSLITLYNDLANQHEKSKNYAASIDYLYNLLDNLKALMGISKHLKELKDNEKENEDKKTETYLKIANLNYKLQKYEATLGALEEIKSVIEGNDPNANCVHKIQGLYRYAQTYEAQGNYAKAIEYLNKVEQVEMSSQSSDDNIYAKSLLHLGRLHFREGSYELSNKNLNKFFKKSKAIDNKELLEIARVNLGMIRGTQGMEDYIKVINTADFDGFLKLKLKYFAE